jgi:multiple sugar transport system permease protein
MTPTAVPGPRRRNRRRLLAHLPLAAVAAVTVFPFYVMVVLSVQHGPLALPRSLLPVHIDFGAYREALAGSDMVRWVGNTLAYSVVSVALVLVFASLAAYAFAKKRFYGRNTLYWSFIAMLMVPYHLTLIPQFILVSKLGLLDTMTGLIVPTLANAQALFLMRQFIIGIPDELIEAAKIDGAGELRLFFRIVLPQCKPILATLGVFVFLWHWNDFLWPLVAMHSPQNYVLTVGLYSLQAKDVSLAVTMAAAVVTFLPVLAVYLLLQRYFVRGVTMTGLK